jgi:hypothetical protein
MIIMIIIMIGPRIVVGKMDLFDIQESSSLEESLELQVFADTLKYSTPQNRREHTFVPALELKAGPQDNHIAHLKSNSN